MIEQFGEQSGEGKIPKPEEGRFNGIINEFKQEMDELMAKAEEFKDRPGEYEKWAAGKRKQRSRKNRERRSKTSNEKILKLWKEAEKQGVDLNDEETLLEFGNVCLVDLNKLFSEKYHLSVPEAELPLVMPFDTEVPFFCEYEGEQGEKKQAIVIGTANDILNGNYISEELAHFYRFRFQPEQKDEWSTHEFFGFLGRKMFKKAVTEGATQFAELDNEEGQELSSRKIVVNLVKQLKKNIRIFKERLEKTNDEAEKLVFQTELDRCIEMRESLTKHHRAYAFAFQTDINKISDWQKLFSMPNVEVRKRFFTEKKNYSSL